MPVKRRSALPALVLLVPAWACSSGEALVVFELSASPDLGAVARVEIKVGAEVKAAQGDVPKQGGTPRRLGIYVTGSSQRAVQVLAFDDAGCRVGGSATGLTVTPVPGKVVTVSVLVGRAAEPCARDGGADLASDTPTEGMETPPDTPSGDTRTEAPAGDAAPDEGAETPMADGPGSDPSGPDAPLPDFPPPDVPPSDTLFTNRTPTPLPAAWPSARQGPAMAYDSAHGKTILFSGATSIADTWEWNGGAWKQRMVSGPPGRVLHGMAYDAAHGKVVLFGGSDSTYTYRDDLWEWDGTAWTDRTPSPRPAAWPGGRREVALTYDEARGKVVLMGGISMSDKVYDDVWEWDSGAGAWTDRTPDPLPAAWPLPRSDRGLTYDSSRARVVQFGGFYYDGIGYYYYQDLWEWNGVSGTWTDRTPAMIPTAWPTKRAYSTFCYDSKAKRIFLFGGNGSSTSTVLFNDAWEWDGAAGSWIDRTPSPLPTDWPAKRFRTPCSFDIARGLVVVFGGNTDSDKINDLWEWDGSK